MREKEMTSLERVLTTLGHREPDRVPLFLLLTMHGAKELGVSIKDYFSRSDYVAEAQVRMLKKYGHDCIYSFFYAAIEVEAWGAEVLYREDGPPNSGQPLIKKPEDIMNLEPPKVRDSACLQKVFEAQKMLKNRVGDTVPIIGVVMSPFSLPVMQMGFKGYIELMYEEPKLFERLMAVNEEFCVQWANAQLEAGARAICYFDPLSSQTATEHELYLKTGCKVAKRTIPRIKGPTATHLASGRCLSRIDDIAQSGTHIVSASILEDLAQMKEACRGKLTILGNLNGIEMRRWSREETEEIVKKTIAQAGQGGGFILSDNHGEIPYQVPDEVLVTLSESVRTWGRYPLQF